MAKKTAPKKAAKKAAPVEPTKNNSFDELDQDLLDQHNSDIAKSIHEKYKGHRIVIDYGKYDPNKKY